MINHKPAMRIVYCHGCRWLLRAAWMTQELLTTFAEELREVTLQPATVSGDFQIFLNDELIWCRRRDAGFPEIKTLKQLVRDRIAPEKSLGHSDVVPSYPEPPASE